MKIKKKHLILIAVFLLFIVIPLGLYLLLPSDPDQLPVPDEGSVEVPVVPDTSLDVNLDEDVENENKELPIFDIIEANNVDKVRYFVGLVNKENWNYTNVKDFFYTWAPGDGTTLYVIDYDIQNDKIFFRFEDPVPISLNNSLGDLSEVKLEVFLEEFVQKYLGSEFRYRDVRSETTQGGYKIKAYRDIAGYPLVKRDLNDYTDYIEVTSDGDLLSGQIQLTHFSDPYAVVPLIETSRLSEIINDPSYPKEYDQDMPIGYTFPSTKGDPPGYGEPGFYGNAPEIPQEEFIEPVGDCDSQSLEIIYLFKGVRQEILVPVYKIECMGSVDIEGSDYDVPLTVYTNAIEPEYVYSE